MIAMITIKVKPWQRGKPPLATLARSTSNKAVSLVAYVMRSRKIEGPSCMQMLT